MLLDDVVGSPNDDGPRMVYADWLQQQPDELDRARGEYISLACAQVRSPKRTARIEELLAKHETAWLGGIAPLLDGRRRSWARGFLDACTLHRTIAAPVAPALGHPAWRTLRTLEMFGSPQPLEAQLALLRQPELVNLRSLYAYQSCLEPLAAGPCTARIIELAVAPSGPPLGQLITVLRASCFERLRRLHVFGCSPELGCALMQPDLTLIAIAAPHTLATWIRQLTDTDATFDEVRLASSVHPQLARHGIELVIRRGTSDRWSALVVRWSEDNERRLREAVIDALGGLPEATVERLSFVGPSTARFDVARWKQRIVAAVEPRQPGIVLEL